MKRARKRWRPSPGPPRSAETILVVEDEEIVRELVCQVLADKGYDVLCAPNGLEALRLSAAHAGPIKLLITDVVMPEMGGLELARQSLRRAPGYQGALCLRILGE